MAWAVSVAAERIESVPFDAAPIEVADPEYSVTQPGLGTLGDLSSAAAPDPLTVGADAPAGLLALPPLDAQRLVITAPPPAAAPPAVSSAPPFAAAPPASRWTRLGQNLATATPAQRLGLGVVSVLALGASLAVLLETRRFVRWKNALVRHADDPTAAGRCESCGYLIAISFQDACPECGGTRVFLHPRSAAGWVWAYLRHRRFGA